MNSEDTEAIAKAVLTPVQLHLWILARVACEKQPLLTYKQLHHHLWVSGEITCSRERMGRILRRAKQKIAIEQELREQGEPRDFNTIEMNGEVQSVADEVMRKVLGLKD